MYNITRKNDVILIKNIFIALWLNNCFINENTRNSFINEILEISDAFLPLYSNNIKQWKYGNDMLKA